MGEDGEDGEGRRKMKEEGVKVKDEKIGEGGIDEKP